MSPTFWSPPRRVGRRVLATTAALGLALSLTACTIGETDDDDEVAAGTTSTAAVSTDEQPTDVVGTPQVGVDQLVLNSGDAPELGLVPVSTEEITGGVSSLEELAAGVRVDPPHCADFSQDAFLAQAEPGVMAIQSGQIEQTTYAVSVTTVTTSLPERGELIEDCPTMTVTIPVEGTEMTAQTRNALLPLEAPEGVEHFAAISQTNAMDMMGQEIRTGSVLITGIIRGIGVSVTAANGTGQASDAERDTAMDAFTEQVEKVRRS